MQLSKRDNEGPVEKVLPAIRKAVRPHAWRPLFLCVFLLVLCSLAYGQVNFENRPITRIDIVFDGSEQDPTAAEQFRITASEALGPTYSAVKIRDSLEALHKSGKITSAVIEASDSGAGGVVVKYVIKRQVQALKVTVEVGNTVGDPVTEQDILFKLNLMNPGTAVTQHTIDVNIDLIREFLRDRGYYNADIKAKIQPVEHQTDVGVHFDVAPNVQATVEAFNIDIQGFDTATLQKSIKLKPGELYSLDRLNADVEKIKTVLRNKDYLAPQIDEPRRLYDDAKNAITIDLKGKVGPVVKVTVDTDKEKIGNATQTKLLPVKRDATLDYAAIVEGERRLENYYQEQGYFFANVTPICSVEPAFAEGEASAVENNTEFLCSALGGADLANRTVDLNYKVDLNRRLRLVDIRVRGTDKLTYEDISTVLESQPANILGIIPLFGYGRGYTSERILETDVNTIRSLMRELGYRDAQVRVNQGVSTAGDDLIITFIVDEGLPTVINAVDVAGNVEVPTADLMALISSLAGKNYSRARIRNAERKLSQFYSDQGYYDARITSSIIEPAPDPNAAEVPIKVQFNEENEGKKVVIARVLVTGNEKTKTQAIEKALTLHPNNFLRAADIYTSEQNLYGSDAFSRVDIKPQPAGPGPNNSRLTDIIVSVEEQAPRLLSYGGGFSTDLGANGFFDIRHVNLLGNLWQGGARISWSQRQQLIQLNFINPRFIADGKDRFAPLTISAQYQRDSTVTRFFRSAFDKGTFGIVQRVDEDGKPIDEFGQPAGDPTINRLTFTAETNRTINRKRRSILFVRYRFEDVRLFNIESLLIKDLLRPDSRIRISGFGATFVRDTRENCTVKNTLLELIAKGEPGSPCKYNAVDPTRGDYFTAEYNVSLPVLGANIGFNKFQASYNIYYTFPQLRNATLAGRAILGVANVFSKGNRFSSAEFPDLNGILPISERFFAGGAYTLRGFDFESAGPRVVIVPQGTFRNSKGEPVTLDPFTVPFGGNAMAVINLEARIPITKSLKAVPFYDGGNVFRRVGDIFNPPDVPANDVFRQNLRALWSHTVGLGIRLKTPIGGEFGIDYGYLLNPPEFQIPQPVGPNAIYRLHQSQIHFRFSQAF
jgi:outer membrane protein insertion porin family